MKLLVLWFAVVQQNQRTDGIPVTNITNITIATTNQTAISNNNVFEVVIGSIFVAIAVVAFLLLLDCWIKCIKRIGPKEISFTFYKSR